MSFIKFNVLIDDFLSDLGIKASAVPVRNIDFCGTSFYVKNDILPRNLGSHES